MFRCLHKHLHVRTHQVEDMRYLFEDKAEFNDDIDSWQTSQVENFTSMFAGAMRMSGRPGLGRGPWAGKCP